MTSSTKRIALPPKEEKAIPMHNVLKMGEYGYVNMQGGPKNHTEFIVLY